MNHQTTMLEEVADAQDKTAFQASDEQQRRNGAWLQAHWGELLPEARGKFLAVAGQEAFLANTSAEAWAKAKDAHPEDAGAICLYIRPESGPRIYANRGRMVCL